MPVGIQRTVANQIRKNMTFEILSFPHIKHFLTENKETGIDPMLSNHRLFDELLALASAVCDDSAVLRPNRHRGDRANPAMILMKFHQLAEMHIAQAIAIGGVEEIA